MRHRMRSGARDGESSPQLLLCTGRLQDNLMDARFKAEPDWRGFWNPVRLRGADTRARNPLWDD